MVNVPNIPIDRKIGEIQIPINKEKMNAIPVAERCYMCRHECPLWVQCRELAFISLKNTDHALIDVYSNNGEIDTSTDVPMIRFTDDFLKTLEQLPCR